MEVANSRKGRTGTPGEQRRQGDWRMGKSHMQGPANMVVVLWALKLGTLLLTMYLCEKSASNRGTVMLPLASDNQGNVYGLLNDHTKKMPTAGLLIKIMFQLTAHSCSLMASRVKRDLNQRPLPQNCSSPYPPTVAHMK